MITLFDDEKIISESSNKAVILTTHRICYENSENGTTHTQRIMLEHITSCKNYHSNNILLIIFAGLSILLAVYFGTNEQPEYTLGAFIIGMLLLIIYVITRKNLIVISSASTKMRINANGMKKQSVLDFINKVEVAIDKKTNCYNAVSR